MWATAATASVSASACGAATVPAVSIVSGQLRLPRRPAARRHSAAIAAAAQQQQKQQRVDSAAGAAAAEPRTLSAQHAQQQQQRGRLFSKAAIAAPIVATLLTAGVAFAGEPQVYYLRVDCAPAAADAAQALTPPELSGQQVDDAVQQLTRRLEERFDQQEKKFAQLEDKVNILSGRIELLLDRLGEAAEEVQDAQLRGAGTWLISMVLMFGLLWSQSSSL
eukprot:jgi/Chlat1/2131/Chrsp17S02717